MEPIDWPDGSSEFWWMETQATKRSKKRRFLGHLIRRFEEEYFATFGDNNAYSRSICRDDFNARFLPGETPPEFPPR